MRKAFTVILIGGSLAISGSVAFANQQGEQIDNTPVRPQYQAIAPSFGTSLPAVTSSVEVSQGKVPEREGSRWTGTGHDR
jgi:enamine deaminase RidA (YjgF/YER057c/UK114 family)